MDEGRNKGWNAVCIGKMNFIFSIRCLKRGPLRSLQVAANSLALDRERAGSSTERIVLSFLTF